MGLSLYGGTVILAPPPLRLRILYRDPGRTKLQMVTWVTKKFGARQGPGHKSPAPPLPTPIKSSYRNINP